MYRFRSDWQEEFDEELAALIREAYAVGCQKAFEVQAAGLNLK